MRLLRLAAASSLASGLLVPVAMAQPATTDVVRLIECRGDVRAYGGLAFWLMESPDNAASLGWRETPSDNPFLREFNLPNEIGVFGASTRTIVFGANSVLAVLDAVGPDDLARRLGVTPMSTAADKFLGEKVVKEATIDEDGLKTTSRVALNVSTVASHPGKTLAGCSYAIEVE